MGSPNFRFKQFTVWHDRCAMKVGTDGVLLGAWCPLPITNNQSPITNNQSPHLTWEVDEFPGRLEGLVLAELELPREDYPYEKPPFVGEEVTGNPRYYNANM